MLPILDPTISPMCHLELKARSVTLSRPPPQKKKCHVLFEWPLNATEARTLEIGWVARKRPLKHMCQRDVAVRLKRVLRNLLML